MQANILLGNLPWHVLWVPPKEYHNNPYYWEGKYGITSLHIHIRQGTDVLSKSYVEVLTHDFFIDFKLIFMYD